MELFLSKVKYSIHYYIVVNQGLTVFDKFQGLCKKLKSARAGALICGKQQSKLK